MVQEKIGAVHYSNPLDVVNTYKHTNSLVSKAQDTEPLKFLRAFGVGLGQGYGVSEGNLKFGQDNGRVYLDKGGYYVQDKPSFELIC